MGQEIKDYTLHNKKDFKLSKPQNEIVEFLLNNDYAYNAAQTGLGKTLSTLTAAVHKIVENPEKDIHFILLLTGPAVPAFRNTLDNILGIPYNIYTATSKKVMDGARFHIFNYSTLREGIIPKKLNKNSELGTNPYFEKLKELRRLHENLFLIADEAHVLQDPNAAQYKVVNIIKSFFIGMWFLTATPILNDLDGFFYMTELTHPGFWGNIYRFKNKYQILETNQIYIYDKRRRKSVARNTVNVIGYKNLDELSREFDKIGIIRALEYKLHFHYRTTKLTETSKKYYQLAADGLFSGTEQVKGKKKKSEKVQHGARLHDLQRVVSNSHKDFNFYEGDNLSEKEVLLIKTIMEVIDKEEATLIYFSYRESLERVKTLLNKVQHELNIPRIHEIHGGISQTKRARTEQTIGARDIVLITSAGTESVNLQRANNLIFYEIPFAVRQFIQACGRITRTDTTFNEFDIYILEAEGTIDTYKKNRIIANSEVIQGVMGGSNALPTQLLDITLEDIKTMKDELLWRK